LDRHLNIESFAHFTPFARQPMLNKIMKKAVLALVAFPLNVSKLARILPLLIPWGQSERRISNQKRQERKDRLHRLRHPENYRMK
jgi:hypothetical protein